MKRVDVSNRIGVKGGQQVRVVISPKAALKASFILYMGPVLALIVGAVLGNYLSPHHKELWAASMGIGFLVGSYFVIEALNKHFENKA
jgi:sigma-E factor negative regulatory protein RseC